MLQPYIYGIVYGAVYTLQVLEGPSKTFPVTLQQLTSDFFPYFDRKCRHNAYDDTIVCCTNTPTPYLQHPASRLKLAWIFEV